MSNTSFNDIYDAPHNYRDLLIIHPIKVKQYYHFQYAVKCLMLRKNWSSEIRFLRMSYLKYLLTLIVEDDSAECELEDQLRLLLRLVLGEGFKNASVAFDVERPMLYINEIAITDVDFNKIIDIILSQNYVHFNRKLSEEMHNAINKVSGYNSRNDTSSELDLEDMMIIYHMEIGVSYEFIHELPVRKFSKTVSKIRKRLMFNAYAYASLKGGKSMDDYFDHETNNVDYSQYFTNSTATQNKIDN